jgi:hypothetical protein
VNNNIQKTIGEPRDYEKNEENNGEGFKRTPDLSIPLPPKPVVAPVFAELVRESIAQTEPSTEVPQPAAKLPEPVA